MFAAYRTIMTDIEMRRMMDLPSSYEKMLREVLPISDWDSEEMYDTPERWAKMMKEMSTPEPFTFTVFDNPGNDEMVVVDNIPFASLCAHHLLPFVGVCHIAYIPGSKIAGLSKLPRLVKHFAKGTWNQEGLTERIASELQGPLRDPVGVAVIMQAEHTCMTIRGFQVPGARTTTSSMKGAFGDHTKLARQELFQILQLRSTR
jgi:GTP cyclohydrolase I